jgi:hypothetical protein
MADGENEYDYTGLHAFVFIDHVPEGDTPRSLAEKLRGMGRPPEGPVMFASDAVGPYLAFAHLRVEEDDLAGLQDLISGALWERGVHCRHCVETKVYTDPSERVIGTKRSTPEIIGLVSIVVEPGRVDDVLEQLGRVKAFKGASVVTGDFDILLQLGGETLREVLEAGMGDLQHVDGIRHTSTALLDGRR